jgi:glycine/D-amino acid oxidase-like deaminating enzyme
MLQWEIDAPLAELAGHIGLEEAAAIYRQSLKAVAGLGRLVAALDIPCAFRPRSTLYLAAREVGYGELVEEHRLRRRAGLPGQLLDAGQLRRGFDLDAPGAILSPGSAECDPLCLAQGLVALARAGGVRVLDGEATAFGHERGRPMVEFAGGQAVEADHVVLATGYALPACIHSPLHKVVASWAVKTLPQAPEALWRDGALIWEASEAYAYLRTTGDGGIIIGGEDQIVADAQERDRLLAAKAERLCERLHELRPRAHAEIGARWTGFFGETKDGLPLIGPVPGLPGFFGAYGYGGNGITFSFLASRLITGMIEGERPGWARSLRIDRGA